MKGKKLIKSEIVRLIRNGVFNLTKFEDINSIISFHDLGEAMSLDGIERLLSDLGCDDYPAKKVLPKPKDTEIVDRKGGAGGEGGNKGQGGGGAGGGAGGGVGGAGGGVIKG